jgi:hypothetical protein
VSLLRADEAVDCIDPFFQGARCRVFQGLLGDLLDGPRIELGIFERAGERNADDLLSAGRLRSFVTWPN